MRRIKMGRGERSWSEVTKNLRIDENGEGERGIEKVEQWRQNGRRGVEEGFQLSGRESGGTEGKTEKKRDRRREGEAKRRKGRTSEADIRGRSWKSGR